MNLGNAAPLEILWALMYTIAAGNFATELRQGFRDRANLKAVQKAGYLTVDEVYGRMIEVNRTIQGSSVLLAMAIAWAIPGWISIVLPDPAASANTSTVVARIIGLLYLVLFVAAGVLLLVLSLLLRRYTRRQRVTLLSRRRRSDTPESRSYLERERREE